MLNPVSLPVPGSSQCQTDSKAAKCPYIYLFPKSMYLPNVIGMLLGFFCCPKSLLTVILQGKQSLFLPDLVCNSICQPSNEVFTLPAIFRMESIWNGWIPTSFHGLDMDNFLAGNPANLLFHAHYGIHMEHLWNGTFVEEWMFSTGNRDMVIYLELGGIERKGRIGTKGKWIGYLAYIENVRRHVGACFFQLSCKRWRESARRPIVLLTVAWECVSWRA